MEIYHNHCTNLYFICRKSLRLARLIIKVFSWGTNMVLMVGITNSSLQGSTWFNLYVLPPHRLAPPDCCKLSVMWPCSFPTFSSQGFYFVGQWSPLSARTFLQLFTVNGKNDTLWTINFILIYMLNV